MSYSKIIQNPWESNDAVDPRIKIVKISLKSPFTSVLVKNHRIQSLIEGKEIAQNLAEAPMKTEETPPTWSSLTTCGRAKGNLKPSSNPSFQAHTDYGYQWKPLKKAKQQGKKLYKKVLEATAERYCW